MHIPIFEISYEDGEKISQYLLSGKIVHMKAVLDKTNLENTVEVDLWYATSLDLGLFLGDELAAMSFDFGSMNTKPLFTLRIATYPCLNCDEEFKKKHCVSDGNYCGFTPAFYQAFGLDK